MRRMNQRYITKKISEHKICKQDVIDILKTELNIITSDLHELINKHETITEEIEFIVDLKYNPMRKINKGI